MLKTIAAILAIALLTVLVLALTKPDSFRVERQATIAAPPDKVFALINDLHQWQAWSPWERKDPAMQRTHSGATSGKGAAYAWSGNKNVGSGRMEIIDSVPPSRVLIQLDFITPFEGHNTAEFTLQPQGSGTTVTWDMYGPTPFISKLMQVFFSFDKMIGNDFQAGLDSMKAIAERP
ncbi:MAG: SRPBCC family protein [Pseudomonadota bacterium]